MYYPLTLFLSIGTGIVFFLQGNIYEAVSYGIIISFVVSIPILLNRSIRDPKRHRLKVDRIVFWLVALNVPGSLYFHADFSQLQYDRFLHFAVGVLLVPLVLRFLFFLRPDLVMTRRLFVSIFLILFLGLFAWEGHQLVRDRLIGTKTFFDYSQDIGRDFWEDIFFGTAGLIVSSVVLRRKKLENA